MTLKGVVQGLAAAAAGVLAYAVLVEPRWVQLKRQKIHIRTLPEPLEGLRVGLLSDLHVERRGSAAVVERAVRVIMRARPDLIAVTGDFAEDDEGLERVLDALTPLEAPLGVFAVPGNHDHKAGIHHWHRSMRVRKAIRDLTNRFVMIERDGLRICVGGVDDFQEGRPQLTMPPPDSRDLTIVLAHSPDQAEHCRRSYDAVDLIVSGHTHGGQVRVPLLGAPVNSAQYPDLYEQGLRRRPWTQVYTTRGLGTSGLPIRFLARPEVTLLELTRAARPRL